ncbi:hypothetical protein CC2G_008250 [Coprinopsis cinerea AmutBmut pab1-1]|nr:hypothetical protein CC2G_008250 [Coprinopsis cinerea AmutBmut pab1-1]
MFRTNPLLGAPRGRTWCRLKASQAIQPHRFLNLPGRQPTRPSPLSLFRRSGAAIDVVAVVRTYPNSHPGDPTPQASTSALVQSRALNPSFPSPSSLTSSDLSLDEVRAQLAKLVCLPSETPTAEETWASYASNCPSEVRRLAEEVDFIEGVGEGLTRTPYNPCISYRNTTR